MGADQTSTWGETCVALGVRWGRRVSPRLAPIGDSGGHALVGSGKMLGRFVSAPERWLGGLG